MNKWLKPAIIILLVTASVSPSYYLAQKAMDKWNWQAEHLNLNFSKYLRYTS